MPDHPGDVPGGSVTGRSDAPGSVADIQASALGYLARREHSRLELQRKLADKGFDGSLVGTVIDELAARNLQSDRRYAEQYVRLRAEKGYGVLRIRAELGERGIGAADIRFGFDENNIDWFENACRARLKKFGPTAPADIRERARQERYLQYRGFSWEETREAIAADAT